MIPFPSTGAVTLILAAVALRGADLSYTFQYDGNPQHGVVVDVRFDVNAAGPQQLVLPSKYGGQNEMWRSISGLEVIGGPVKLQPGPRPDLRRIHASGNGPCQIRYRVAGVTGPLGHSVYYWPILKSEYMHLLGKAFLVMPDWPELSPVSIELSWRLPDGWVAINSLGLGEGAQRFSGSLFQLRQGVYVAGDFRLRRFEIRGKPAAVALRGRWGFTDDEFATFVNRIVAAQRAFWKDDDLPKGANLDPSFRYLFFHELFHTWNPNKLTHSGGVPPALYWFSEGFTDYYAYVLQMLEGFESFPDHMDRMTKIMSRYWTWRTRNLPNHAAAQDYYSDPEAQKVAYFRGTLVALNWNAAIREASQGKSSLNDFMRALKSRVERTHEELTHAVLVSEAERFGIGGAEKQIARWIDHGDTVEVRSDSFGPCAEMIGTDPPQFRIARQQCVEWFK